MIRSLRALLLCVVALGIAVQAAAQPPSPVSVSSALSKSALRPGDQAAVAVIFEIEEPWHIWPNEPETIEDLDGFTPIPTRIEPAPGKPEPAGVRVGVGSLQWPKAEPFNTMAGGGAAAVSIKAYGGRAVVFVPITVDSTAAPGERTVSLAVSWQACDDKVCIAPDGTTLSIRLPIIASDQPAEATKPELFKDFDTTVFARLSTTGVSSTAAAKPLEFGLFGKKIITIQPGGMGGLLLLLAMAAVGGFLLNLTPCVLPVIPIKILSLSAAAGNPARCLYLGVMMSIGVVAFWLAIGGAIAFISSFKAINQLFQVPWFSLGVGLFIGIMGIGMVGLFSIKLPQAVYLLDPKRESAMGSVLFGVMTAILSTPCTAPFMGTAAAWAAKQLPIVTLATFGAIGLGMALPYLVLAAKPKLVKRVPKSGPASVLVKEVMGLLMIAVAAFFIGTGLDPLLRTAIDPPIRSHWWVVAGFVAIAMGWLAYRTHRITAKPAPRIIWTALALLFALASFAIARSLTDHGPIAWTAYTPERFQERIAKGEVIVMDFTAEWCLNCKALESGVLHQKEVVELLQSEGVTAMKVDLTGRNEPGQEKLKSLNWVGIPLLAIYGPGLEEPLKFDTYTPATVRDAVERARKH